VLSPCVFEAKVAYGVCLRVAVDVWVQNNGSASPRFLPLVPLNALLSDWRCLKVADKGLPVLMVVHSSSTHSNLMVPETKELGVKESILQGRTDPLLIG